jgi:hypothetical protein
MRNYPKSITPAPSSSSRTTFLNYSNRRAIVCLMLALQWGGTVYAWNSSHIIGLFVGFALMIIIFIIIQIKRGDKATLPLSIFKQRTVTSAGLYVIFLGAGLFVLIYYSTFPFHLLIQSQSIFKQSRVLRRRNQDSNYYP